MVRLGQVLLAALMLTAVLLLAPFSGRIVGQGSPSVTPRIGEWWTYGGDLANTRYSPLDQISGSNFGSLEVAWRFRTDSLGPQPEVNYQTTPLMVGGVVYATAGSRRAVVALDAATGELRWMYSEDEGPRGAAAPRRLSGRGLAYWSDGRDARVIYVTPGYRMIALDVRTGRRVPGFGADGVVDLKLDNDQTTDPVTGELGLHATPIIAKDIIVVGSAQLQGGVPKSRSNEKGYVRAFDVRTGKRLWTFHTLPLPGEVGFDSWEGDSASYTGNVGVWTQMSIDEELETVYLPVELPTGDYYGGHRPGNGLFGESLVAVDLRTGTRKWHFQLVHHGIWDSDVPSAPILADITVDGRAIKAVAQPTKQGWLFVFDRTNGNPVWPIPERAVPKGDVPGEWYSPTQPFPSKPPAYDLQGISENDLIDFTPELRAEALKLASLYKLGPIYTPPVVSRWEGPRALIMVPGAQGGANWQGGAFDPETRMVYIPSKTAPSPIGLVEPTPDRSDMRYVQGTAPAPPGATPAPGGLAVQGLPLWKPPYGRITAIDLNKGELVWQVAHGETPDNIRNHPALKGLTIPRTGRPGQIGVLATKTLIVSGEAGTFTMPNGQRGAMLRAYDKATGAELGAVPMPGGQTGSPMTYLVNGRQHIVLAINNGTGSELIAFRLPAPAR